MGRNQHVVPHNGAWGVRGSGNGRVTAKASTQAKAIEIARNIAGKQKTEVIIHRPNGQIREGDNYGEPLR